MDTNSVKVSVVIPVFNAGKYLKMCLNSLLAQTTHDFEVICVDDGSKDESRDILQSYKRKFYKMIILNQNNKGAGAARNVGLRHAQGEYVYFMDADDCCHRNLLSKAVAAADSTKADIVCFHFKKMKPNGRRVRSNGYRQEWVDSEEDVFNYQSCPDHILSVVNPTPWNKLYRRKFLLENELKFEEISSTNDITFAAVSCAKAGRITAVNKALYYYRIGHGGTITAEKPKRLENVVKAIESTIDQVSRLPYYSTIRKSLQQFVIENYIFSLKNYAKDLSTPQAQSFYNAVHDCFCSDLFSETEDLHLGNTEVKKEFQIIRKYGYTNLMKEKNRRVIVSMTSYPERISFAAEALKTLIRQSYPADEIILWLAESQFPGKENELPKELEKMIQEQQVSIRWCDDLKAHKKYFFALQDYPDDLIITVDDDLYYEPDLIKNLLESYLLNPNAVSTVRAHLITSDSKRGVLPYEEWIKEMHSCIGKPSMQLFCTGGAGALYPAYLFSEVPFDAKDISDNCPYADDIWLKILEVYAGIPVVIASKYKDLRYIDGSQENRLFDYNSKNNDRQLVNSIIWLEEKYGKGYFYKQVGADAVDENLYNEETLISHFTGRIDDIETELWSIKGSKAYKVGKPIVCFVRKCKDYIKKRI